MDSTSKQTTLITPDIKSKRLVKTEGRDAEYLKELKQMSQRGRIELIMGPMFAGKSTELLRRVNRLEISGKTCLSVKYSADTRYSTECISTHDR